MRKNNASTRRTDRSFWEKEAGEMENMGDILAVRNECRMPNWAVLVPACSESGLSNREFCRQQGISEKRYYYWQRKLREQAVETLVSELP